MIPRDSESALSSALDDARTLADLGVPIIAGRLDATGNPDGRDPRWNSWQKTRPNHRPADRWRDGEGLGAVTGSVFDVLDMDPRNGGEESLRLMSQALGDDGPDEYWRVATSSGGRHLWIAPLGLGTHNAFLPGLDLKSRGGFVFIPPTVRPSKGLANLGELVRYRAVSRLERPVGTDTTGGPIRDFITECLANRSGGLGGGRRDVTDLEQACLSAGDGEQREALLALVSELQRKFDDDGYVVYRAMQVVAEMEDFDKRRPWKEADVRGMLFSGGSRPIADASGEEAALLASLRDGGPAVAAAVSGLKKLSSVQRQTLRWVWYRYLAIGDASLIDSFAGVGKSLTALDVVARATRGRAMPGEEAALCGPLNVLLLAPEDRASVQRMRLEAAGADLEMVFIPDIEIREARAARGKKPERKAYLGGHLITFPTSVEQFHKWIKAYRIGLVVVDPVAAFLDQDINSSNDASVRRALEPFVTILGMEECSAWLIRHFNKDSKQSASLRGGGSVAFGAVARTHMIAGEMPMDIPGDATHGIALVKTNNVRRKKGVALGYTIEDSEIEADDVGTMVPRVEWHGEVTVDVEELSGKPRKGPAPTAQPRWTELFDKLFGQQDTWAVAEIREAAEAAGLAWDHNVYDRPADRYGIRPFAVGKRGGGKRHYWTIRKTRVAEVGEARRGRTTKA